MNELTEFEFMKPEVKLISVTPDAEKHMAYCARVSNPAIKRMKSSLDYSSIVSNINTGASLNKLR